MVTNKDMKQMLTNKKLEIEAFMFSERLQVNLLQIFTNHQELSKILFNELENV